VGFLKPLMSVRADPSGRAVCGRSFAGFMGSNPEGVMDDCLLRVLCVVK